MCDVPGNQPAPPANPDPESQGTHYVKGMSYGGTDLKRELMTLQGASENELVITLAPCTPTTEDPLCP